MTMWTGRAHGLRPILMSLLLLVAMALGAGAVSAAPPSPVTVGPPSLDFGTLLVNDTSSTLTVTVTAGRKDVVFQAGTDDGQYSILGSGSCTVGGYQLVAGASCTIDLAFKPLIAGSWPATLAVDTCMKWELNVATGVPHCLRVKDTATVSLAGSGTNGP